MNNRDFNPTHPAPKILIFGLPRTKTTMVQMHLARTTSLLSLSEPYSGNDCGGKDDVYKWTQNQPSCIIKLLTQNLADNSNLDFFKLWQCGFNRLVLTDRRNHTDAAVSLYCAENVLNRYHHQHSHQRPTDHFNVDLDWIKNWCRNLDVWHRVLREIRRRDIKHDYIFYEDYCPGSPQTVAGCSFDPGSIDIPFVDLALDYQELCDNYKQVEDVIKDYSSKYS